MYRLILVLFLSFSIYLIPTDESQAGMPLTPCVESECQDNEDECLNNCEPESIGGECQWDGENCRNPGACCFLDDFQAIDCNEASEFNCANELNGEYQGDGVTCSEITCTESEPSPGPVVTVPTMNQWGIIFASIILGVIGIVAIIREKDMDKYLNK